MRHGPYITLVLGLSGDLWVDSHTVEDVGIVLGQALKEALGDQQSVLVMERLLYLVETLGMASLDLSGRNYLVFDASFDKSKLGNFDTELVKNFQALAFNVQMNLHLKILHGKQSPQVRRVSSRQQDVPCVR